MNGQDRKLIDEVRVELANKIDLLRGDVFSAIAGITKELREFKDNKVSDLVTKEDCNGRHKTLTSSNIIYAVLIFLLGSALTAIIVLLAR